MKRVYHIWQLSGSIHLTFYLIIAIMVDLTLGFFSLRSHGELFHPLNDMGLVKWAGTYGAGNPRETAWLFILIGLMTLFSINTFVCTTHRVISLFQQHPASRTRGRFILRLSPHIMHYALLIMFLGYLVSYLAGQTYLTNVLLPGRSVTVPGTTSVVTLKDLTIDYYKGDRLPHMQDRGIGVKAVLSIQRGKESMTRVLGFNRPVRCHANSLHLRDFSPKSISGMATRKYIEFTIKKDPGLAFYFSGMMLFTLGLVLYMLKLGIDGKVILPLGGKK